MGIFRKLKKVDNNNLLQDLSITYDKTTDTYIITTHNENRKVRVLKSNGSNLVIDTCYKKQGRPKKG